MPSLRLFISIFFFVVPVLLASSLQASVKTLKKTNADTSIDSTSEPALETLQPSDVEIDAAVEAVESGNIHKSEQTNGKIIEDDTQNSGTKDYLKKPLQYLDRSQNEISKQLLTFSNSIDEFFSDRRLDLESNTSRILLELINAYEERKDPLLNANLRVRLRLPGTEKKLQLIVDRFESPSEANQPIGDIQANKSSPVSSALRYFFTNTKEWNAHADAGIKLVLPLEPFAKMHVSRSFFLTSWTIRATQRLYWFHFEGPGESTLLHLDFPFENKNFLFRSASLAIYSLDKEEFDLSHNFLLFQKINDKSGLTYHTGVNGSSRPTVNVSAYHMGVGYRKRLYKKWLFFEAHTQGTWPRELHFTFVPSVLFKIQVVFGHI